MSLVLSLADLWAAIKRSSSLLLFAAVACGTLGTLSRLNKPISYTATALFKTAKEADRLGAAANALGKLTIDDKYLAQDDASYFLTSLPVLENAVRQLDLQAYISEKGRSFLLKRIWNNVRIERNNLRLKKKCRPASAILGGQSVPDHLLFQDPKSCLRCKAVRYEAETFTQLGLLFNDSCHYTVYSGKHEIGHGVLGEPFVWEKGTFTLLEGDRGPLSEKQFCLTLTPLPALCKSLQQSLTVRKDKKNSHCLHLAYTHSNRHLAAAVVNAAMEGYLQFLEQQGHEKLSKQLSYFEKRQKTLRQNLERFTEEKLSLMNQHLEEGGLFEAAEAAQCLYHIQTEALASRCRIEKELLQLGALLEPPPKNLEELFIRLDEQESKAPHLSLEGAREAIAYNQKHLDETLLSASSYDLYLAELAAPSAKLSPLLDSCDPTLNALFNKITEAQLHLVDRQNFSQKEQDFLKEQIGLQKACLTEHLSTLREGCVFMERCLRAKLTELQKELLCLLRHEYALLKDFLAHIGEKSKQIPLQTFADNQLQIELAVHRELVESLGLMVESKSAAYYTESCAAAPLVRALPPSLPNSPRVIFYGLLGFILAPLGLTAFLLFLEAYKGPSGCPTNLRAASLHYLGRYKEPHGLESLSKQERSTLNELLYKLRASSRLLFLSQKKSRYPECAATLLAKEGPSVLLIQGLEHSEEEPFAYTRTGNILTLRSALPLSEVLRSSAFLQLLEDFKESKILFSFTNLDALPLFPSLGSSWIYLVTNERLDWLMTLPQETLFLVRETKQRPFFSPLHFLKRQKQLHLRQIVPLLEELRQTKDQLRTKIRTALRKPD